MVKKKAGFISEKTLEPRPPVVAVLGHVDHGKTTLLDYIRRTNVATSEAGGITQHIGAYRVRHKGKTITFIDTPGHVAFSKMRSRGAKVADLVVLVVAADESVKPQTLESLKHIHAAKVPYLVALTKKDLPNINIERVKKDLVKHKVKLEKHGGDIVSVSVSGKTGRGVKELLEMIIILAEMAELEGSETNPFTGVVIESGLDSRRGPLATILIQDGRLEVGDEIAAEGQSVKVKAMFDENGKRVDTAKPSRPVEVLGFKTVLPVGSKVKKTNEKRELQENLQVHSIQDKQRRIEGVGEEQGVTAVIKEDSEMKPEMGEKEKRLKIILKADTFGTLEAIVGSLPKEVQIIHSGVGRVNGSDVLLAETTRSQIVAFNVKVAKAAQKLAETERIEIACFKIIYRLLEDVEEKVLKMTKSAVEEKILGRAEIIEEFEIKKEKIAGCRVIEGEVKKTDRFHLSRKGKLIGNCRIKSMKTGKRNIEKVKKDEMFGAVLTPKLDFQIGDVLISFHKVEES